MAQAPPVNPPIRVEYFGAERGFAIGMQAVTMLCVLRNTGAAPIAENTLRLRCYTLAGLDYTTGETWPVLPSIGAGQTVAYRWVLVPAANGGPLIASALITENKPINVAAPGPANDFAANFAPQAVLNVIPRLAAEPKLDPPNVPPGAAPQAVASEDSAWLGNERVGVRIVAAGNREPILLLGGKFGADWKLLALSASLFSVLSGEPGQIPWRQTFHWSDSRPASTHAGAALTLRGALGTQWRGEVTLQTQSGTAAIQGTFRLTARRLMRLYDCQIPRLIARDAAKPLPGAANGTPNAFSDLPAVLPENARIAAARTGPFTFGIAWPGNFAYANWTAQKNPAVPLTDFPLLGAAWRSGPGTLMQPGETIEIPFRLFAFAPSETLRDALRFLEN